jgi:predicted dehydrogenase
MKALIIGGGSIGTRHSNNLNHLGINTRTVDIDEIENIDHILKDKFDFGLVCSPNINHVEHCLKLAEHDIHIFCEKPFYSSPEGAEELLRIVEEKKLTTMVGCNLRFTPEVNSINPSANYINVYFGYNLKKWRPEANHLESYSANKNLGGGVLLDAIHELDYLYYKFGEIESINYIAQKLTDITRDTEDFVTGTIKFTRGTTADFCLNYLCGEYTRYFDVVNGCHLHRKNIVPTDQMYIDEIKYFVSCLKSNRVPMNNLNEAHYLLKKLL